MGGAVSAGDDNDELVDNLVEADYIKSPSLESIFRAVDRGFYYTDGHRDTAYRDTAWKNGNLHLSAPCIYSEVMEALKLSPGLSFLNIGSGTGYLSTMAGLILGSKGINHGVELHPEVVSYANKKLDQFIGNSPSLYHYDLCQPVFVVGNALLIGEIQQYDRVYCGASVLPELCDYMKSLLKIGGILVMPQADQLVQVTRSQESKYETKLILPVSFASLVTPHPDLGRESVFNTVARLPEVFYQPSSLKQLCAQLVLSTLREVVRKELPHPDARNRKKIVRKTKKLAKKVSKRLVFPIFEESDLSTDTEDGNDSDLGREADAGESGRGGNNSHESNSSPPARQSLANNLRSRVAAATRSVANSPISVMLHHVMSGSHENDTDSSSDSSDLMRNPSPASSSTSSPPVNGTSHENRETSSPASFSSSGERNKRSISITEDDEDGEAATRRVSTSSQGEDSGIASSNGSTSSSARKKNAMRALRGQIESQILNNRRRTKLRRVTLATSDSDSDEDPSVEERNASVSTDEEEDSPRIQGIDLLLKQSENDVFVEKLKEKIKELPLPASLRIFVNLNRPL